uniref:Zinc finger MYND domain-containing protein 11 n=1 Tax=Glossina brevipalpis TaxID=37001 RepID=A0A1A9WVM2_9MUSC
MAQSTRKAQPDSLGYFLKILRCPSETSITADGREGSATMEHLVDILVKVGKYSNVFAKDTVLSGIHDGLLRPVGGNTGKSLKASSVDMKKRFRLPLLREIDISSHDFYCYECQLPGVMEHCRQCARSFHRLCYRKNPERPNYTVPSSKIQKNRLPAFSAESGTDSGEDTARFSTPLGYESDVRASSSTMHLVERRKEEENHANSPIDDVNCVNSFSTVEGKPLVYDVDAENKSKVDIVYLGEIRPPNRKRRTTTACSISYKNEMSLTEDEDEMITQLCTCCRLLKSADLRSPPNLEADELCALINYTFQRNRGWISCDVVTYFEQQKLSADEFKIIKCLLFMSPIKRLKDVLENIQNRRYSLLMEFFVDLLDIQYQIGVFFGPHSTEMESTKWFLRDIAHDLSEIRRCPDCFRYSHEQATPAWFAKPCVQRHELVFAKHSGFPYWPAKVIRVLNNGKYDVRFFGGKHSRALIDVSHIKAIDSDIKSLKLGNRPSIKKAMEELHCHQMLSKYPPSKFGFHANPQETEEIIRNVMDTLVRSGLVKKKHENGKRRHSSAGNGSSITPSGEGAPFLALSNNNTSGNSPIICPEVTVQLKRLNVQDLSQGFASDGNEMPRHTTRRSKQLSVSHESCRASNAIVEELSKTRQMLNDFKQQAERLQTQKRKLKETIHKLDLQCKVAKRKQWCHWCLEEANFLCCFEAAYCSEICQMRHWDNGHRKVCKSPTKPTDSTTN